MEFNSFLHRNFERTLFWSSFEKPQFFVSVREGFFFMSIKLKNQSLTVFLCISLQNNPDGIISNQSIHNKKNEIALAKVSLTIVLIFILCHSVKWIPNIYEVVR